MATDRILVINSVLPHDEFNRLEQCFRKNRFKQIYRPMSFKCSETTLPARIAKRLSVLLSKLRSEPMRWKMICARTGDYSLINDRQKSLSILAVIDLTSYWNPVWGGLISVRDLGSGQTIALPPKKNTLIVVPAKNARWYLKRINHHARRERVLIVGESKKKRLNTS